MKKKQLDPEPYLLEALDMCREHEPHLHCYSDEADGKKALSEFAYRLNVLVSRGNARDTGPIDHEYVTHLYFAIDALKMGRYRKACNHLGNAVHCTVSIPALRAISDTLVPYLK